MRAAKYLGVPVWELHERAPVVWRNRAMVALNAESSAKSQLDAWERTKAQHQQMRRGGRHR